MCKISLAMTTYNGEMYIEKQLTSIVKQSKSVDEVVICDDCSTDKTTEIIEQFINNNKLKNWKLYINKSNKGFAENFKQAIKYTTGDIIFLSDQDDEWKRDKIQIMSDIVLNDNQKKLLACSLGFIDQDSISFMPQDLPKWYKKMNEQPENKLTKVDFLDECITNFSPGCTMCFTRKVADEYINSLYKYPIHHDWLLGLIASAEDGFFFLNKPLIDYRIHRNNAIGISTAAKSKTVEQQIDRLLKLKSRYKIGIQKNYSNRDYLDNNLKYIDKRISFYKNRSLKNLLLVWIASSKTKKIYNKKLLVNIKDALYFLHLIFK